MAGEEKDIKRSSRRKHSTPTSRKSYKVRQKHDSAAASLATASERPPTLDALRKARLDYLETPVEDRPKRMKYVYDQAIPKSRSGKDRDRQSTVSLTRRKTDEPKKRRRRKDSSDRDAQSDDGYVYGIPEKEEVERKPESGSKSRSRDHVAPKATVKKSTSSKATVKRELPRRNTEPAQVRTQRRSSCPADDSTVIEDAHPAPRRRTTVAEEPHRSSLKRSVTTHDVPTEVSIARTATTTSPSKRRDSGIFSSLLLPKPPQTAEKKVPCLTCGADDVPISRSARLPCKHRMCHSCLRRIFKMSITDPAHMPPRCCTDDHIDLKHVDKLFNQEFKKNWNRKFLEYKTRNKVYCIGKNCGEWIKPHHITVEHGRKIGKCKRCGTRVCAICNNKAHTSRDCPKDPATKEFIETAKQKGWQKCYSCSAMVELKEGCNHMTCRCTAEFCMVCGVKWKGCDCPWFNYENVDAHLGNPIRYQEELDRRRDQEQRDEVLARRMQALGVNGPGNGPRDEMFGVGNAAGHHMNANFIQQAREALTANYQNAEQAARGLLNGWVTGRENPLPGLDDMPEIFRRPPAAVNATVTLPAERVRIQVVDPAEGPRPARRGTNRRRSALVDMLAGGGRSQTMQEREQEQRIQDWASGVAPGS